MAPILARTKLGCDEPETIRPSLIQRAVGHTDLSKNACGGTVRPWIRARPDEPRIPSALALGVSILTRYQAIAPSSGLIWHGRDCQATTVRIAADLRKAKQALLDLKKMRDADAPPRLILNDHCQICEFCQRCHVQAVQEDNLSLLRGLSEKEIRGYSRKGILTVTQLAHTFRPRRQGKRARQGPARRYHALQAMALRDRRIYVFGTPDFPTPDQVSREVVHVPQIRRSALE